MAKVNRELAHDVEWVIDWCREHATDLAPFRGERVVLHELFGVLFHSVDCDELFLKVGTLRKRIRCDIAFIEVDVMLEKVGRPGLKVVPRPDAPMKPHRQSQKPVPEKNDPPPPLSPQIDPFDNDIVIDGSYPSGQRLGPDGWPIADGISLKPSGSFPSPHKQPPFMPRVSPASNVRLDGVSNPGIRGSSGRGIRYD